MKVQPTTRPGRETVDGILDASCILFARQGIRATTLDEICALSGTGRGQLYRFFVDKADLVAEVIAQQVNRVLDAQQPLLGRIATAADVREWCAAAVTVHESSSDPVRCPIGSLVHELGDRDGAARAALTDGFARWKAALADGLRRVQQRGELALGADPDGVAMTLLAVYQGGLLLARGSGDSRPLREALYAVTSTALVAT